MLLVTIKSIYLRSIVLIATYFIVTITTNGVFNPAAATIFSSSKKSMKLDYLSMTPLDVHPPIIPSAHFSTVISQYFYFLSTCHSAGHIEHVLEVHYLTGFAS
jgi:hypothetical protein